MNNPQEKILFPQRLNAFLSLKWGDPHTKREERVFFFLKKKNGRRPKDERTQKNHPFKKKAFFPLSSFEG